jgi:phage gp16-like protein
MSYKIKPYHLEQAKRLGVTIKPSSKKFYKLDIYKDNEYLTSIGDKRYLDYMLYMEIDPELAEKRRKLYWNRHKKDGLREKLAREILW